MQENGRNQAKQVDSEPFQAPLEETWANDPDSLFKITAIDVSGQVSAYYNPASPRKNYTLWKSSNMEEWTTVAGQESIPGDSGPLVNSPADNEKSVFYRIGAEL